MTFEAVYELSGMRAVSTHYAIGPWTPTTQHGAAPASLVAWLADTMESRQPMQVARLSIDLLRPVPVAPLSIETEIIREGRKIQVASIRLLAEETEIVRATVLRVRVDNSLQLAGVAELEFDHAGPEAGCEPSDLRGLGSPFLSGISMRTLKADGKRRRGATWHRADRPVIAGLPNSPLMCAAITADFCNGNSVPLDPRAWSFINADLTLSLSRVPVGEWILLDAESCVGPAGTGVAFARLADRQGYFGRAVQSLVIERRDGARADQQRKATHEPA
jgi:hypothetical protein